MIRAKAGGDVRFDGCFFESQLESTEGDDWDQTADVQLGNSLLEWIVCSFTART
jgi:hypothetical protein